MGLKSSKETHFGRMKLGDEAMAAGGREDEAIQHYSAALDLNPNYALAYLQRGKAHQKKGEFELAIHDFEDCLVLDDTLHVARFAKIECLEAQDEFELAVMELSRIPPHLRANYESKKKAVKEFEIDLAGSQSVVDAEEDDRFQKFHDDFVKEQVRRQNRFDFIHGRRGQYVISAAERRRRQQRADQKYRFQVFEASNGAFHQLGPK